MRQQGRKNRQTYRLVVTDIRTPRDGKYLEMLGWYNPFSAGVDSSVNNDRINYWVNLGAEISPNAESIIARIAPDLMKDLRAKEQEHRQKKVAKRRALKK